MHLCGAIYISGLCDLGGVICNSCASMCWIVGVGGGCGGSNVRRCGGVGVVNLCFCMV